ncbi:MAG: class I SAM-dependent methyltransferase [Eubacterium sp.]|nr:class I SAM-dependent methyltransferase [Eubacterium sp.]
MSEYESFAKVYDLFMDNIDYDAWCRDLVGALRKFGVDDGLVCELGCGTGSMTERLAAAGYDMIGIDSSIEMLNIAEEKKQVHSPEVNDETRQDRISDEDMPDMDTAMYKSHDILYLCQDMREFELYGTVRAVVSVCDSMSYILEEEDMLQVLKLVNNYLDPGGVFLFDLNTENYFRKIGDSTVAENREEGSFIWDNFYDEEEKVNEYDLTLFLPQDEKKQQAVGADLDENHSGNRKKQQTGLTLYQKYQEQHVERAWSAEEIRQLVEQAGLEFIGAIEAFTHKPVSEDSDRICIAAREIHKIPGQPGKLR